MTVVQERPRRVWLWIVLAALVLTALLGAMVFDRNRLLSTGREIVVPVIPVDPRSLFQGDYVRLGYQFAQFSDSDLPAMGLTGTRTPVYVTLRKNAAGLWERAAVSETWPVTLAADDVVLAGVMRWRNAEFGIETFFVPEGKGREIETLIGDKKLSAAIAVDASGRAALAGLLVDGQPAYREPWY